MWIYLLFLQHFPFQATMQLIMIISKNLKGRIGRISLVSILVDTDEARNWLSRFFHTFAPRFAVRVSLKLSRLRIALAEQGAKAQATQRQDAQARRQKWSRSSMDRIEVS